jgi:hypothetical protein
MTMASYEIWLGPNRIAVWEAGSPLVALVEYLRGEGVSDDDIVRLGANEVSWRGAIYRARPVPSHAEHRDVPVVR